MIDRHLVNLHGSVPCRRDEEISACDSHLIYTDVSLKRILWALFASEDMNMFSSLRQRYIQNVIEDDQKVIA